MRGNEVIATGQLAAEGLGGLATRIEELHSAIAGRAFGNAGPAATPARAAHDTISAGVYTVVRKAATATGFVAGRAIAATRPPDAPAYADTPRGGFLVGTLNGFLGDRLSERGHGLAVQMTVRQNGHPVALDRSSLAAAYPFAGPWVAVFLHGLCESENAWALGTAREDGPPAPTYGERLRDDLDYTPVLIRHNSGRRISDNGRDLDALLTQLHANWPVEIEGIVLIGHSMGALIARSACHSGTGAESAWTRCVTHTVSLGAPHMGAPLEQSVNMASRVLRRIPEGRPVSSFLELRSNGIRDLRHGAIVEEDWRDYEPDEVHDRCTDVPLLPGVRHCAISATLHRDPKHPASRLLGDLLVRHESATGAGRRRRIAFEVDDMRHVGGINHFRLLNDPVVYEQLRDWLS